MKSFVKTFVASIAYVAPACMLCACNMGAMETTKNSSPVDVDYLQKNSKRVTKGAAFFCSLLKKSNEGIKNQTQFTPHDTVINLLSYLYKLAYKKLPDKQSKKKVYITIPSKNRYHDALNSFFAAYQLYGKEQDVKQAQTTDAFRLLWTDEEPFLGKYRYFHIGLTDKGIQVKADNGHKMQVAKTLSALIPFAKKNCYCNRTQVPNDLIDIFKKQFPDKKFAQTTELGQPAVKDMYAHIREAFGKSTGEEKEKFGACLNNFLQCAMRYRLDYLKQRIGAEVILAKENFYDGYFSDRPYTGIDDQIDWITLCKAYDEFIKLRDKIYCYVTDNNNSLEKQTLEIKIKENIDDLYDLTKSKLMRLIDNQDIRLFLTHSATLLKTYRIRAEMGSSLKKYLITPLFEEEYQLENSPSLLDELINQRMKLDAALNAHILALSAKYQKIFTKRLEGALGKNTELDELCDKKNKGFDLIEKIFKLIKGTICNLTTFPASQETMSILGRDFFGSLELISEQPIILSVFKSKLELLFGAMSKEAKKHGWISSMSEEGIFFPDMAGLNGSVESIYGSCS